LLVATDSYDNMPKNNPDGPLPSATEPPLLKHFSSPWAGTTVKDYVHWLQEVPADTVMDTEYFTMMNESAKEDDCMFACRVKSQGKDLTIEYFPQPIDAIAMEMWTNDGLKFDEKAHNYQASRRADGKPDMGKSRPACMVDIEHLR
jgi:hypothetical protein